MSIPKQPRQLMINIMYLVLTALLALNVSAEIFNAFKVVDAGLINSNKTLDDNNSKLPGLISDRAKKTKGLEVYAERTGPARTFSKELSDWIDNLVGQMIDDSGDKDGVPYSPGDYIEYKGVQFLKGQKNKDVTTRFLVNDGRGAELKVKIEEYRNKFLGLIDEEDREAWENKIALSIDDESWRRSIDKTKKSWEDFNFRQMPLGATLPIFTKFKNDAKSSEAAVLNYLMGKVGGDEIVLDQFQVVSSPKKTYVINGETFETDIFLSAFASQSNTEISIRVNGSYIPDQDGLAHFTTRANGVGIKTYTAEISVTNPVTGEVKPYRNTFEYEVGERSVTVSPSKMNVFYMGVDNPVEISAAGVATKDVQVNMSGAGGGAITRNADGTYNVRVTKPTRVDEFAKINVSAPGLNASKDFRVKRIPDPVARLSRATGGSMSSGEFKAQAGLGAYLDNFDFDAKCEILGFRLVRVPQRQDAQIVTNRGGRYLAESSKIVNQAKPGDTFYYENVKAKCPGDDAGRDINTLVFKIR